VMERINTRNACHFFTACRAERPRSTYAIDVASPAVLDAVPHFRHRCGLDGAAVVRPDWRLPLDPVQAALMRLVDGRRTLRTIVAEAAGDPATTGYDAERFAALARTLMQLLVNRDFVVLGIGS